MKFPEIENGKFFFADTMEGQRQLFKKDGTFNAIICETGKSASLALILSATADCTIVQSSSACKLKVMFDLDDKELSERASSMATAELEANTHRTSETHHKEMAKSEKTIAEKWENQRHNLANAVKYKQEERETKCPEFFDYETNRAYCINPNEMKIMQNRPLVGDERTPPLIDVPKDEEEEVAALCETCGQETCICPNNEDVPVCNNCEQVDCICDQPKEVNLPELNLTDTKTEDAADKERISDTQGYANIIRGVDVSAPQVEPDDSMSDTMEAVINFDDVEEEIQVD
jgi:hypothetical protein